MCRIHTNPWCPIAEGHVRGSYWSPVHGTYLYWPQWGRSLHHLGFSWCFFRQFWLHMWLHLKSCRMSWWASWPPGNGPWSCWRIAVDLEVLLIQRSTGVWVWDAAAWHAFKYDMSKCCWPHWQNNKVKNLKVCQDRYMASLNAARPKRADDDDDRTSGRRKVDVINQKSEPCNSCWSGIAHSYQSCRSISLQTSELGIGLSLFELHKFQLALKSALEGGYKELTISALGWGVRRWPEEVWGTPSSTL